MYTSMPATILLPQPTTVQREQTEHISSSERLDPRYHKLELLLIGFTSVVVTFLWIGVFSTVFQTHQAGIPSQRTLFFSQFLQNTGEHARVLFVDLLTSAGLVEDTLSYQFVSLWESSCLPEEACGIAMNFPLFGDLESPFGNDALVNKQYTKVAALSESIFSLQLFEAKEQFLSIITPESAYASDVLGAKTGTSKEFLQKGVEEYFSYIDTITFGAISTFEPELVK